MDDLKLYVKSEKQTNTLVRTVCVCLAPTSAWSLG